MYKSMQLVLSVLVCIVTACGTSELNDNIERQQFAVASLPEGSQLAGSTLASEGLSKSSDRSPTEPMGVGREDSATISPVIEQSAGFWPPRCGPRNCIAMCVTCEYDCCLHSGGSLAECQADRESCKELCFHIPY